MKVNDIHSQLNETRIAEFVRPETEEDVAAAVSRSASLSVCGGRHSMGGQQFLTDGVLLDMSAMDKVAVDWERGIARIGAGALWPQIDHELVETQGGNPFRLTFRQKQTGGDRLSIGGSLASNIHTRGLAFAPFVEDIESFRIVLANGETVTASRSVNADLFKLAVGGYGLFGVVTYVDLRLVKRHKLRRDVEIRRSEGLMDAFAARAAAGYEYGDFQFAIDPDSDDFLDRGVFACYLPVHNDTPVKAEVKVPKQAWHELVYMAHERKSEAFQLYADFYSRTSGQIYWSDSHQMTPYLDNYHRRLDRRVKARCPGSEMITELYVPRDNFEQFMTKARAYLREERANVIYGTVRVVERDRESFLAWAKESWACTIFNLHVDHDDEGIERAKNQFKGLIDIAQSFGGSYYLTYHRWASRDQVLASYPQMPEFLAKKELYDPGGKFQSDWYNSMRRLIRDGY